MPAGIKAWAEAALRPARILIFMDSSAHQLALLGFAVATIALVRRSARRRGRAVHVHPSLPRPKVGVGIVLQDPRTDRIVMGRRIGSHGAGTWHWPGGHLEGGESPQETAARELLEETGIAIPASSVRVLGFTNDVFAAEGKHYVTIECHAWWDGKHQPRTMEPDKCRGWVWKTWQQARELRPLFLPARNFMAQAGFVPPSGAQHFQ